jgi:hypothetical protein
MQSLQLRNPPMIGSASAKADVVTKSYGLATFGPHGSSHLASKSINFGGFPRLVKSALTSRKTTAQQPQNKKHVLICQAAPSAISQATENASPADATTAAYSKLQNGSDIRGVALDGKYYMTLLKYCNAI